MELTFNGYLRSESDAAIISNLQRKGWVEAPRPIFDTGAQECVWQNGAWVVQAKTEAKPYAKSYQVRAWLIRQGIDLAMIPALIESVTQAGPEREEALMRWEYVSDVAADHPLVTAVAQKLGLSIDTVWPEILDIN